MQGVTKDPISSLDESFTILCECSDSMNAPLVSV